MAKKLPKRTCTKTVGYGYVGMWIDGTPGWFLPTFLSGGDRYTEPPNTEASKYVRPEGDYFVKCRITIQVIKGKRGIPVRKRVERKDPT
jgi:hypothetical protein